MKDELSALQKVTEMKKSRRWQQKFQQLNKAKIAIQKELCLKIKKKVYKRARSKEVKKFTEEK